MKSGKNACSADLHMVFIREVGFVWRQLELAFFGAVTPVAALFILKGKKKMKKIAVLLVALTILSLCLLSCNNSNAIKDKLCASEWEFNWEGVQSETYKFNTDGTYSLTINSALFNAGEQTGTYTVSDGKIELIRTNDSYKSELTYTYSNNILTLTCRNKTVSK